MKVSDKGKVEEMGISELREILYPGVPILSHIVSMTWCPQQLFVKPDLIPKHFEVLSSTHKLKHFTNIDTENMNI